MRHEKSFLSFDNQISLLKKRGLNISDEMFAMLVLQNVSYYRLSAYMFPFQQKESSEHKYKPDVSFEEIASLYFFDRELRLLVFDAIERIEIAFRTQLVYRFSEKHGWNWYEERGLYNDSVIFEKTIRKLDEEIKRSGELFIKHYRSKYGEPGNPPACMTIEITTAGLLAQMYRGIKMCDAKKEVAEYFGLHPYILESWIQSMSYVRNICAHHSRLWNRVLTIKPTLPKTTSYIWINEKPLNDTKLYPLLCALVYLIKVINPNSHFTNKFHKLLEKYPSTKLNYMGFPPGWKKEKIWEQNPVYTHTPKSDID
jgi:abortive infection bacteriophage resistance protein